MIEVLQALPVHAAVIAEIHAAAAERPWSAADYRGLLEKPGILGLLAMEADQPLGFLLVQRGADEAEILYIATLPAARRRGIARGLIVSIVQQLRKTGTTALYLDVAADNAPARALYSGLGFAQAGRRPCYYRRGDGPVDALLLRLNLVEGATRTS